MHIKTHTQQILTKEQPAVLCPGVYYRSHINQYINTVDWRRGGQQQGLNQGYSVCVCARVCVGVCVCVYTAEEVFDALVLY